MTYTESIPAPRRSKISAVILTWNEEVNLRACIESVKWCDEVVVFDSFSTDATTSIARECGAHVVHRKFDDYASQRNAALAEVDYTNDWILMIDSDERVTELLKAELLSAVEAASAEQCLFRVRRKDMFGGRWIRHSSGYPTWFARLLRKGEVIVKRAINEEYETRGQTAFLREHLTHYPFNKGVEWWFARHNRYSTLEAAAVIEERKLKLRVRDLISGDPIKRRRILKSIAYRLPFRPFAVFWFLFAFRLGFLDGRPGYHYARMRALYEYLIDLKILEISREL